MLASNVHSFGGKMTTVSAVASSLRIATAASAIAAAATLAPTAVANAADTPSVGNSLAAAAIAPCDPQDPTCADVPGTVAGPAALATPGASASAPALANPPYFWFGAPANPSFVPLIGIAFPSFGLNFEACFLGAAVHLSPYGTGFIGLGLGC